MSVGSVNEVRLVGRLSGEPVVRVLPSGDELTVWRLVVARSPDKAAARSPSVDTIDCVARRPSIRRMAVRWSAGDTLEVKGALRRRFWRGAGGPASRCEVEVSAATRARAVTATAVVTARTRERGQVAPGG
jgi:single-strand DNA-binding protein